MKKIDNALLNILSASINGHLKDEIKLTNEEWEELFQEACSHQIHLIIYPTCKKLFELNPELLTLSEHWHKVYVIGSLQMDTRLSDIHNVLKTFEENDIKTMILKGLYFREFYPNPNSRTMGDVDLFVLPEQLEKATNLILDRGYTRTYDENSTMHYSFVHPKYINIELHYSIISINLQQSALSFNQEIWSNIDNFNLNGVKCTIPSYLYHKLYCSLHMAKHFKSCGFGLRQLTDFAMLVKNTDNQFNWDLFFERSDYYGIGRFTGALLLICNKYFNISLPQSVLKKLPYESSYIHLLLDEIFVSGVFGAKSVAHVNNVALAKYKFSNNANKTNSRLRYYFPPAQKLSSNYKYAKRYPIMLPVAWMHRLVINIMRADLSLSAKAPDNEMIDSRIKLLSWLDIR